jgi:hypothetical protein
MVKSCGGLFPREDAEYHLCVSLIPNERMNLTKRVVTPRGKKVMYTSVVLEVSWYIVNLYRSD